MLFSLAKMKCAIICEIAGDCHEKNLNGGLVCRRNFLDHH
jgi:hypothetical protein